ncbi:uncharacterized protein [Venturia canescens]|uniref:uncharacterized protein n=1 Tax=Venturia canescens TaxID=32260 RepID=UPI001C9C8307|nr:uncharacterized protein LOC122413152 [Venturia canescens]
MALISGLLVTKILATILVVFAGIYVYFKYYLYEFWRRKGVAYVESSPPTGILARVVAAKISIGELYAEAYAQQKSNRYFGTYGFHKPCLVVADPDIIKYILTKGFNHFHDRGVYCNEKVDPLSGHLFFMRGPKWRALRTKLTPTFTPGKLKQMYGTIVEIGDKLAEYLKPIAEKREIAEFKDIMARYTTDTIMSTAFGLDANSLENPNSEIRYWGRRVFDPHPFWNTVAIFAPQVMDFFSISLTERPIINFFVNAFTETMQLRKANNVQRPDFMHLLMQLIDRGYVDADVGDNPSNNDEVSHVKMTVLEAVAQAYEFFVAGFETSATTASYCLYELAANQDIQDEVRKDIDVALQKFGGITHESVQSMTYLHKTVCETLRKYPALPMLNRVCTKDVVVPTTNLHMNKGVDVLIPILGIHRDPDIYPDPDKFDPERFSEANIAARHPYTYLPWGEGPRVCIGMRFAHAQVKVGIICMLSKYRISLGPDMTGPIKYDPALPVLSALGGINLRVDMALISGLLVTKILATILVVFAGIYVYFKYYLYEFWRRKGVAYVESSPPTGILARVVAAKISIGELYAEAYAQQKSNRYFGTYGFHKPCLVVAEPDIIKYILTKGFNHFHDRGVYCNEKVDPLSGHLFFMRGPKWRALRTKLTPTFTPGKLKQMYGTIVEIGNKLTESLKPIAEKREIAEFKDIMARYTTDTIMSVAFGMDANSLENPNSEIRYWGRKVLAPHPFWNTLAIFAPQVMDFFSIPFTERPIVNFFVNAFTETMQFRKANNVQRPDFMHLLMQLIDRGYVDADLGDKPSNKAEESHVKMTVLEAVAQAYVFFVAGFETSATTASYCLYELAANQNIQDEVRKDIDVALQKFGGITHESVQSMTYLHKTVCETLRKYPALPMLNRVCTEDVVVPTTNLHMNKGVDVLIPILGIHRDPDIYPDPDKFDPERFSEANIAARHPYTYLPWGEGPRVCIGMRFAHAQVKVGIICMLSKYRISLGPDMTGPIKYDPALPALSALGGINLRVEPR